MPAGSSRYCRCTLPICLFFASHPKGRHFPRPSTHGEGFRETGSATQKGKGKAPKITRGEQGGLDPHRWVGNPQILAQTWEGNVGLSGAPVPIFPQAAVTHPFPVSHPTPSPDPQTISYPPSSFILLPIVTLPLTAPKTPLCLSHQLFHPKSPSPHPVSICMGYLFSFQK